MALPLKDLALVFQLLEHLGRDFGVVRLLHRLATKDSPVPHPVHLVRDSPTSGANFSAAEKSHPAIFLVCGQTRGPFVR